MTYTASDVPVRGGMLRIGRWAGAGDGTAVLAVHGITASHMCWSGVADAVPELELIAPDLRGRGRSSTLPGPAGLRRHAEDLLAVLDHLGIERVVVAGHSMGGLVAVVMANAYPDRVSRLVLVDGGLPLELAAGTTVDQAVAATLGPAAERLSATYPTRAAYREFWAAHPAFTSGLGEYIESYIDYDIEPAGSGFASSVSVDRVREDAIDMFDPQVLTPALLALRHPAIFLRAPRGLLDQPEALYSPAVVARWTDELALLSAHDVDDVNHYTIMFALHAVGEIAAALRESA